MMAMLAVVAANPLTDYLRKFTNRTFSGIYQPNAFDMA